MTVDSSGIVHLVWVEDIEESTPVILYSQMDGGTWTAPVDIVAPDAGYDINKLALTIDSRGYLQLVYNSSGLAYTSVYAPLATSARNWQAPKTIAPSRNNSSTHDLAIGPQDDLHVVYAIQIGAGSGVYHISSSDHGQTWQGPRLLYRNPYNDRMVDEPKITVDGQGKLHAVWIEMNYPDTSSSTGIRYSNSTDGVVWSMPVTLASGPYYVPEIASNKNEIHIVWSGTWSVKGDDRFKFHIWSKDGGMSWSETWRNEELGGIQGKPAFVFDSAGRAYWLQVGEVFELNRHAVYENIFTDGVWSQGAVILSTNLGTHEKDVVASIGLGNELHVTVWSPVSEENGEWVGDITYLKKTLDSPHFQPQLLAEPTLTPSLIPTQPAPATVRPTSPFTFEDTPNPQSTYSVQSIIAIGIAPVIMIIGILIAVRWLKSG